MNERTKAIVRLCVMIILLINMVLTMAGKNPIPFDESEITEFLTTVIGFGYSVWCWWKNNNVTNAAMNAQKVLDDTKTMTIINK